MKIKHEPELTIIDTIEEDEEVIGFQYNVNKRRRTVGTVEDLSKLFSCDLCPKKYLSRRSIIRHVSCHSRQELLSRYRAGNYKPTPSVPGFCELCQKEVRSMKYHREIFHSSVSHHCDLCDFSTKYSANLLTHKHRMHNDKKKFSCTHCKKTYNDQSNKNRHMRTSHPELYDKVLFECPICPSSVTFNRQDNLKLHLKRIHGIVHNAVKPQKFLCDLCSSCNVTFLTKNSLISHMRKEHIEESRARKFFACAVCSKKFILKDSLVSHLNSFHLKKFLCRYCEKILGSKKTLAEHEARGKCHN